MPKVGRGAAWLAGAAAMYGALVTVACSGDDTTAGTSPDAATDSTVADVVVADTAQPQDTSTPDTSTPDAADAAPSCIGATDAASLDDAEVQRGLAAVMAFKCYGCHQSTPVDSGLVLNGKTTSIVDGGMIYPKNLTPDPDAGIGCWTNDQIAYAILNAVDDQDASLCVMPKFTTKGMDASTAQSIANFLRTLAPSGQQIPESTCPVSDAGSDAMDAGDG